MKAEGILIEITWQDAWSNDCDWQGIEHINSYADSSINRTVGYVTKEDRRQIVLAQSVDKSRKRFATLTGIPIGCILKRRKIK